MFSVEFDHDEVCITVVDDTENYEDLVVNSFDDIVFIRQWDEEINRMQVIAMSPDMWEELITSIHSSEGVYISKRR